MVSSGTSVPRNHSGRDVIFLRLRLLGDIIFTIPAIQLYLANHPHDRIYYVVEERFVEVARLIPGIHQVIGVGPGMKLSHLLRFRRDARAIGAELLVDFHCGPKSALLARFSGATVRAGYRTPNRNWAYNLLEPRWREGVSRHSVANQARLLTLLGIDGQPLPYPPDIAARTSAADLPAILPGWPTTASLAILHLGAGNRFRDWGEDNFSALAERLTKDGVATALVGNNREEIARGARLQRRIPAVLDWTGWLSITAMLHLIARASVYLGADSGPLHLASLTATPLVALYGPNVTEVSGPWRRNSATILEKEFSCHPCCQRRCLYGTIPCMRSISVDEVYEAMVRYIG